MGLIGAQLSKPKHPSASAISTSTPAAARRIPCATYRLQFNKQFTFKNAATLAEYLHDLGISDCYASPLFQAGPQSTHGYDVCSLDELNVNLGNVSDFDCFATRLQECGLGLLLDIVPNHMGAHLCNRLWRDVLQRGPTSPFAQWFDIDWNSPIPGLRGKVLLPILEDHYSSVLEAGKLKLAFDQGKFVVVYQENKLPLAPNSLSYLLKESSETERIVGEFLRYMNGTPGVANSFDRLHSLLQQQHYRLAFWRTAIEEINYRRFFDVTDLVSLRMELPEVFRAAHQLVFRLIRKGKVTGVRIDHPDGLWNPKQYLDRLQRACADLAEETRLSPYIVVEKILTGNEDLPRDWPIDGTTGYDFLNRVNGLFVDGANYAAMTKIYQEFASDIPDFKSLVHACKRKVLHGSFVSELNALALRLKTIASTTRQGFDLTALQLGEALAEFLVAFPIYRTYLTEQTVELSLSDRQSITHALLLARQHCPHLDPKVFDFLGDLFLLKLPANELEPTHAREFVMRLQQLTGPLMAKGLEDTAFYNFNRLISLNEVGGDPDAFGTAPESFHAYNLAKSEHWPHALLATATHDTKRGEDARARINVLSEMPNEWRQSALRWHELNAEKKSSHNSHPVPDANDEYLLYQTLVGAWSAEAETATGLKLFRQRIVAYMLKAIREAKVHTSWANPAPEYERGTTGFVEKLLATGSSNPFLDDFKQFQRRLAFFGRFNSLSQLLIKLTAPGVPDLYQGTELWDFSLVDPDNRRPVDFDLRRQMLLEMQDRAASPSSDISAYCCSLLENAHTGEIKLYSIWRSMQLRRRSPRLFEEGAYVPLAPVGPKAKHAFAFARTLDGQTAITIVPRLVLGLTQGDQIAPLGRKLWQDTLLEVPASCRPSSGQCRNVFTGELISLTASAAGLHIGDALALFPIALLECVGAESRL